MYPYSGTFETVVQFFGNERGQRVPVGLVGPLLLEFEQMFLEP